MRKTPFAYCMVFPFGGIGCIVVFFVMQAIGTAPVRTYKATLDRQTEMDKALITSERELFDHRLETGVIEPFDRLIISGYTDNHEFPPRVNFVSIDPAVKTLIYDQYGICTGFAKGNRFIWKHTEQGLNPDVCRGVEPVETALTRQRDREQRQQQTGAFYE